MTTLVSAPSLIQKDSILLLLTEHLTVQKFQCLLGLLFYKHQTIFSVLHCFCIVSYFRHLLRCASVCEFAMPCATSKVISNIISCFHLHFILVHLQLLCACFSFLHILRPCKVKNICILVKHAIRHSNFLCKVIEN